MILPKGPYHVLLPDQKTNLDIDAQGQVPTPPGLPGMVCSKLDDNGNAVIEVVGSSDVNPIIDVVAYFYDEKITRDITVKMTDPSSYQDNRPLTPDGR